MVLLYCLWGIMSFTPLQMGRGGCQWQLQQVQPCTPPHHLPRSLTVEPLRMGGDTWKVPEVGVEEGQMNSPLVRSKCGYCMCGSD